MNFLEAVRSGLTKYASARGRASRSEFWYWTLFNFLVGFVAAGADYFIFPSSPWGPIDTVLNLALFLPTWSVGIRRLHDINRNGYWLLIVFTIIGIPLIVYWACVRGSNGDNDYGPDPLKAQAG